MQRDRAARDWPFVASVREIEAMAEDNSDRIKPGLELHPTFESWARESFHMPRLFDCLRGGITSLRGAEPRSCNDHLFRS
jgi:hypothetical protein